VGTGLLFAQGLLIVDVAPTVPIRLFAIGFLIEIVDLQDLVPYRLRVCARTKWGLCTIVSHVFTSSKDRAPGMLALPVACGIFNSE
jgi:hypothetical protein